MSILQSIPPLIPVPQNTANSAPAPACASDTEDLFSTLFSPATPHASPRLDASPGPFTVKPAQPQAARQSHARTWSTASANSDFGAFVSVPAAEDPLAFSPTDAASFAESSTGNRETKPFTPLNDEFFDKFAEDARRANEKNKQDVLGELLAHEEDPLSFLANVGSSSSNTASTSTSLSTSVSTSTSGAPTPARVQSPGGGNADRPLVDLSPGLTGSFPISAEPQQTQDAEPQPQPHPQVHEARHPRRAFNISVPASHSHSHSPPSPTLRSPSLPPSPTASPPVLTRTQSQSTFAAAAASTLPTRWMSSFLARSPPSQAPTHHPSTTSLPHPAARSPSPAIGIPPHHAATIGPAGLGLGLDAGITHGSPFAAHTFVPPSGAPGFAGDRAWNTRGFEFDARGVEKRGVKLVGRKEATEAVLSEAAANEIRPYLPALARLPKTWSLLYSLDQHGISLQTLYSRCENHLGGALVAIKDSSGAVFGVWMGEGIRMSRGSYYGSGESFLFKFSDKLHVFKWTGKNDYVALCEPEYISFGGGDGHYGLYLDDTLFDGSSARCPTFGNEPLCAPGPNKSGNVSFECVGLEVWGVSSS